MLGCVLALMGEETMNENVKMTELLKNAKLPLELVEIISKRVEIWRSVNHGLASGIRSAVIRPHADDHIELELTLDGVDDLRLKINSYTNKWCLKRANELDYDTQFINIEDIKFR